MARYVGSSEGCVRRRIVAWGGLHLPVWTPLSRKAPSCRWHCCSRHHSNSYASRSTTAIIWRGGGARSVSSKLWHGDEGRAFWRPCAHSWLELLTCEDRKRGGSADRPGTPLTPESPMWQVFERAGRFLGARLASSWGVLVVARRVRNIDPRAQCR